MSRLRGGLRTTFSACTVRNYRLYFIGQTITITGTWMQMVAQAWLVLNLSGSAALLGLVAAMQWLPILLLGPWAGVLADRVDKRRLLLATQTATGVLAVLLGALVATDLVQLWMVMAFAGSLGVVSALSMPARQSFVLEMVGPEKAANAISLNTIIINVGRLIGPAVAGLIIAGWDLSVCFFANGIGLLAGIASLTLMRPDELHRAPPVARAKGQLREGFRHVWADPGLRVPLLLMLTVGMLTYEFQVSLPVLARTTFGVDAAGYGLMQTAMSAGAVVGGLAIATRTHPTHRRLGLAAAGFGAVVLVLAVAPTFTAALVVLPVVGVGSVLFLTLANATLQLSAPPEMRSRVMALYTVAFNGSTPIGAPIIGAVSEGWGAQWGLAVGGCAALLAAGLAWRSLRAQPDRRGTTLRSEPGPDPERDEAQAPDARSGTGDLRPRVA